MGYGAIEDQHSMFHDKLRNTLYLDAIKKMVTDESVVLDLGAGLGLHGFMAQACGAKKVYLVEPTFILDVTSKVVKENDLTENIICMSGVIEKVDLPEKVDLIISVFTGNFLLTEDLLPSLFYARDKFLRLGGHMIPDRANMMMVPVSASEYYEKTINCWSESVHSVDYSLARKYAVNTLYYDNPDAWNTDFLAEESTLLEMDFMTADEAACRSKIEIEITEDGMMHGCLGWFDARVGDQWLSTSPAKEQMHWRQVFLPLEDPIYVQKGNIISFELIRPELGDWSWTVEHNGRRQKHTTFLSRPRKMKEMLKLTDGYRGNLSEKGIITQETLYLLDGQYAAKEITVLLLEKYPRYFTIKKQADIFVKNMIEYYT